MDEKPGTHRFQPAFFKAAHIATATLFCFLAVVVFGHSALRSAYASHNDLYVVCPDPIAEGETGHMDVVYPGYRGIGVTVFTYQGSYTADGRDFVWYDRVKMKGDTNSSTLSVPAITKEDESPEHDETFSIGFWGSGLWHGCVVTISDDDAPVVTEVAISSSPGDGDAYRMGESIDTTVTFDSEVEVEGSPTISLLLGDGDAHTWRGGRYAGGSGGRRLTFSYQVQATDLDRDGVSLSGAGVDEDRKPTHGFGGTINASGTDVPADVTHLGIGHSAGHKVDGRPYVQSARITSSPPSEWNAYRANQIIEVAMTFNTEVEVEGDVLVGLYVGLEESNWAEAWRGARYFRGSGTETLEFRYTVRPGDADRKGIRIASGSPTTGFGGSGTVKAKGLDVARSPNYRGTGHLVDHKVDTAAPTISAVTFRSTPSEGETYGVGESVRVEVAFSEDVIVIGNPALALDVGGVPRIAVSAPDRGFGRTLVFEYDVAEGDADTDGIGVSANSLTLNGGTIRDRAGNSAALAHATVAADGGQRVDTSSGGQGG